MHKTPLFCRVCALTCAAVMMLTACGGGSSSSGSGDSAADSQTESSENSGQENSGSENNDSGDSAQSDAQGGSESESGNSSENHTDARRTTLQEFLLPNASGTDTYGNDLVSVDASNVASGYVMVKYNGSSDGAMVQIIAPDESVYSYSLKIGSFETFPLSVGSGKYHIDILEHAYDNMYAVVFSTDTNVELSDEFGPFLYPNQYVWFTKNDAAVQKGMELSSNSSSDLDYVEQVYRYVIGNITYDNEKAANVKADYLPDIDETLSTRKGICFDYASLMSAMLRSQGVPTKLVVGYSGTAYHAWISVYLQEIGWVDNIIQFNGSTWSLMDPTLAASQSGNEEEVGKYVGDGSNYTVKYSY